jgi:VCBS repeat-containing protein
MALIPFRFAGLGGFGARAKTPAFGALDAAKTVREGAVNAGPVQLDPNVTLTNADGTGFGGGRLTVSIAGATAADSFSIREAGGITVSGDAVYYQGARIGTVTSDGAGGSALTVAFDSGPVSNQAATALARSVSYASTGDAPGAAARAVTFQAVDAEKTAGAARMNLKIAADRDAPQVSDLDAHVVRTPQEALTARLVDGDVTVRNPDGTGFSAGSLNVHLDGATAGDDLTLASGPFRIQGTKVYLGTVHVANVTASGQDGADLTIKFKGAAKISDAQMAQLMKQVAHATSDAAPPEGERTLTFTLTDKEGDVTRASVGLTVAQPNRAPAAADDVRTTAEDTPLVIPATELLANDGDLDGDTLSVTGFGGASGGTLVYSGGTFTFKPDADYSGPASFTYTVSDGKGGTDTATVNVTVTPVNDAPVATGDTSTTAEDTALVIAVADLLANDADVDGDMLSVSSVGGAVGGTVALHGGWITFTPDANFNGDASFSYTMSDGKGGTDTATVAVNVTPVTDPPIAVDDEVYLDEDSRIIIQKSDLIGNDINVDGGPLYIDFGPLNHIALSTQYGIGITLTATPDYNGPASFTYFYKNSDGGQLQPATVTIHIRPINDAPVITSDAAATFAENGTGTAYQSAASDVEGDALTFSLSGADADLFTVDADGKVAFKAAPDFEAPADAGGDNVYDIVVAAHDGTDTATKAVTITVTDVEENAAPRIVAFTALPVVAADVGTQGNGSSYPFQFSPDGTTVLFYSFASNLVEGDTNGIDDPFVKDLETGEVTLVSSSASGSVGNNNSYATQFSPDGTKVLFKSYASNLVEGDTNGTYDVFVKDLETGAVTLVNSSTSGTPGNSRSEGYQFSPDGTKVLFLSYASNVVEGDTNGTQDVFVKDLETGAVTLVNSSASGTPGNSFSSAPEFSPDGTKVLFYSDASNLVEDDLNGIYDVFVKDLETGKVTLVSSSSSGTPGNYYSAPVEFSPDGTKVLFSSSASNLVEGDLNGISDAFVKDLETGAVALVSSSASGTPGNNYSYDVRFSPDGTKVLFYSSASNLVEGDLNGAYDVFVKDLETGAVTLVSSSASGTPGNNNSSVIEFSPDGTKVLFWSPASNLVEGDTNGTQDVFVKDLETGAVTLVSSSTAGTPGNGGSSAYRFSPDGTKVLFISYASNVVEGDTNGTHDVFVKDLETGEVTLVSSSSSGAPGNHFSDVPQFSPDGANVLFYSYASNLVESDTNGAQDVFVKNLATGEVTLVSADFDYKTQITQAGSFTFDDDDPSDTHTVSVTPADGTVGTLMATIVPVAGAPDRVDYVYQADRSAVLGLQADETMEETFTLIIDDGHGGTVSQDVVVTVAGTNHAPVAADDTATLSEDGWLNFAAPNVEIFVPWGTPRTDFGLSDLLGNDTDADGYALSVLAVGDATHGTVYMDSPGSSITFIPDANYTGRASFTYTVSDGKGGTDTATVAVTVTPVSDTFVLATDAGARIAHFDAGGWPGDGDDILDIGALVSASDFVAGDDLSDFVWFEDADGDAGTAGAYVMYDADGAGVGAVVQHTQLDGLNVGDTLYLAYGGTTATDLIIL